MTMTNPSPRCLTFLRLYRLVIELEYTARKFDTEQAKHNAKQARRELNKVAAELSSAEMDWCKVALTEDRLGDE